MSALCRNVLQPISLLCAHLTLALAITGVASGSESEEKPLTPEENAVLMPLHGVFDGIAKRDRDEVRRQLLPGGSATLLRDGEVLQLSFEGFVDRIPSDGTQRFEERIHDPLIRIDNDLAIIWAPYEFLIDGVIDHTGTDVVYLVRQNGAWLIAGIADNSRKVPGRAPSAK